jgi:hypothetical protein
MIDMEKIVQISKAIYDEFKPEKIILLAPMPMENLKMTRM